jgi:hypothetical protein
MRVFEPTMRLRWYRRVDSEHFVATGATRIESTLQQYWNNLSYGRESISGKDELAGEWRDIEEVDDVDKW